MKIHPWNKRPYIWKAVNGFMCYQFWAILALFAPTMADRVMYSVLKSQFKGTEHE